MCVETVILSKHKSSSSISVALVYLQSHKKSLPLIIKMYISFLPPSPNCHCDSSPRFLADQQAPANPSSGHSVFVPPSAVTDLPGPWECNPPPCCSLQLAFFRWLPRWMQFPSKDAEKNKICNNFQ